MEENYDRGNVSGHRLPTGFADSKLVSYEGSGTSVRPETNQLMAAGGPMEGAEHAQNGKEEKKSKEEAGISPRALLFDTSIVISGPSFTEVSFVMP